MKESTKKKKTNLSYYEFERCYLPEKYQERIKNAEKKRKDYIEVVGKKIVEEVKKEFCL